MQKETTMCRELWHEAMAVMLSAIGWWQSRGVARSRRAIIDQARIGKWCNDWAVDGGERGAVSGVRLWLLVIEVW